MGTPYTDADTLFCIMRTLFTPQTAIACLISSCVCLSAKDAVTSTPFQLLDLNGMQNVENSLADEAKRLHPDQSWPAAYATRGGPYKGNRDLASTHRENTVYVHALHWPSDSLTLPSLGRKIIASSLLTGGAVNVTQNHTTIQITVAKADQQAVPTIVKWELDGPAADIPPIKVDTIKEQEKNEEKNLEKATETNDPVVTEHVLPNGRTSLHIDSADGKGIAVYEIDLRTHYKPATEASEKIRRWESYQYGAFVHYNLNTFVGNEFTQGPASLYRPNQLNVPSWAKLFSQAGMGYAVLTTRHTSDFLLWPSKTSNQTVAATVEPTDVVKAFADSCRKEGVAPGFYYCMWNRGGHARATIMAQLYELAHDYGPIPYFWIDMVNWAPQDLSPQTVYDLLKSLQPDCIVILNQHIQDGTKMNYFPTDVMNGENLLPPPGGHQKERTVDGVKYYLPMECELVSQSWQNANSGAPGSWFTYGDNLNVPPSAPKPAAQLAKHFRAAYRSGASNVLLSFAPDHSGMFRPEDSAMILELKKEINAPAAINLNAQATASSVYKDDPTYGPAMAVDDNPETRWAAGEGTTSAWLEVDLGKPATLGRAIIEQAYPELQRIRRFAVEYQDGDGWKACYQGENPGARLDLTFGPVSARRVRLHVIESTNGPTISEFQLYPPASGK